eukprot:CAMPEP_0180663046 /NCGR_PEP_ID=MMETSP1037_2-20121125/59731_1 /TAXON_ID=632150 /ORGANISM="Azadinium spinosum, Strain 3D9" /LENGTH=53 /DNA_ID=CAMNT_0022690779 /DNA_START=66 /DNA_END=223 /DNA_ORIENTATION=-
MVVGVGVWTAAVRVSERKEAVQRAGRRDECKMSILTSMRPLHISPMAVVALGR